MRPVEKSAFGDLYLAQDAEALWVGAICSDYMDERLYEGDRVPEMDRQSLTLNLSSLNEPITIRFGGKSRTAASSLPGIDIKEWPGLKHQLAVRIPWSLLGGRPASLGVKASMSQHSRAATMTWDAQVKTQS